MRTLFTQKELARIDGRMTLTHVNGSSCGENTYVYIDGALFATLRAPTNSGDSDNPYEVSGESFGKFFTPYLKAGIVRALVRGGRIKKKGPVVA